MPSVARNRSRQLPGSRPATTSTICGKSTKSFHNRRGWAPHLACVIPSQATAPPPLGRPSYSAGIFILPASVHIGASRHSATSCRPGPRFYYLCFQLLPASLLAIPLRLNSRQEKRREGDKNGRGQR